MKEKFKNNATFFYAFSIAASWAGVGALMNFKTIAVEYGAIPAVVWAVFNSLACILFGLTIEKLPQMRKVMESKIMFWFIGSMNLFQTWTQMNGIREVFGETKLGTITGEVIAYTAVIFFILILLKTGMIRNVLTDGATLYIIYGLVVAITIGSIIATKGQFNDIPLGITKEGMNVGIYKGFLLLPGPFTFPFFFKIYSYNEKNDDGTQRIDVKKSFFWGGILFSVYMAFAGILAWTKFTTELNVMKAILLSAVGISSISTYLYSVYVAFGNKLGLAINIATVALWRILIPMGVMGVWTLMSEMRLYVIIGAFIIALFMKFTKRQGE